MNLTQYLSIEFHSRCNLAGRHAECPSGHPERNAALDTSRRLTDEAIVVLAARMYREFGFRGLVAWHYYNEPLMERERMFRLMEAIRREHAAARFCLWTNGLLLPKDCRQFAAFERVHVTDYGSLDPVRIAALRRACPSAQVHRWPLDDRLSVQGARRNEPCGRMFVEFVVDHYGNVHLCCFDWRGTPAMGNVLTDDLGELVARWRRTRDAICGREMTPLAPAACLTCRKRHPDVGWCDDPEICHAARQYLIARRSEDA